jgi:iron complex outermembrane receptor protein
MRFTLLKIIMELVAYSFRITIFSLLLVAFNFITVSAQHTYNITGVISNLKGAPVKDCSISLLNGSSNVKSDINGTFFIPEVPVGKQIISVKSPGYITLTKTLEIKGNLIVNLKLAEGGRQLEEIVVTAQKRNENLQQVPLSITALNAKQVEEQRIWNISDLTGFIPNFNASNPGDNRNVSSVRGIATTSYDPAVATYIDGVNQFGLDTYISQLQDIERIEVLRGPQGTLYGRNAMGGVINIITKQPDNATTASLELGFGSFASQRYNAVIKSPLVKDKLFFGASALYTKQNGFYTNTFNASRFDDQHSFMGNYYLKYLPSSKLSIILNIKHVVNRNDGAFPLATSIDEALAAPYELSQNNVAEMVDNVLNASLSLNYKGRSFDFSSQSAYQENYRYYKQNIDADFSPLDGYSIISDYGPDWNKVKVSTQEFRFSSPAASITPFDWVVGTYGFYQDNPVKQGTHYGEDGPLIGAPSNFTQINTNISKAMGVALFAQGTYKVTNKLKLTLGARFDLEHKNLTVSADAEAEAAGLENIFPKTKAKANFHAFSPKGTLQYLPGTNHNLYLSYSKGFRAGGISPLSSDPSTPPLNIFRPEFSNNYEIGTKNTFASNHIRINAALFYTQVNNAQVPSLLLPDAVTVTRNAGNLESKGVEIEVSAVPLKNLEINYNLGLTDAKYAGLKLPNNGSLLEQQDYHQIFTPTYTSLLAIQYSYELRYMKIMLRGEYLQLGKQYFDLTNKLEQKSYKTFNGQFGIYSTYVDFFVWEANISDTRYIDYAYDFGAAHLGNPRTFGVTFRSRFKMKKLHP